MEEAELFETSAYKIQTPRNYPEESIQPKEKCLGMWIKIGCFKMASIFRHS
jgi:hypothetical protein